MICPISTRLVERLDEERQDQANSRGDIDRIGKRKRLEVIELLLVKHLRTCGRCCRNTEYLHMMEEAHRR